MHFIIIGPPWFAEPEVFFAIIMIVSISVYLQTLAQYHITPFRMLSNPLFISVSLDPCAVVVGAKVGFVSRDRSNHRLPPQS